MSSSSGEPLSNRAPSGAWPARKPTGVLVIDPIPLFRDGLSALVERTPGVRLLGVTANMHSAITLADRLHPDVVLVDAVLDPRCHLAQLLINADETLTVLSMVREPLRNPRYVAAALAAGVHGLVLRTAEAPQLLDAIRRTHLERRYLDPDLAALATGLGVRHTVTARQPLSRREYQVLQLISDGLENQAVARTLFVSVETIRTHVKSILRKLHARDRAHAVAVAFRLGVLVAHRETAASEVPAGRPTTAPLPRPATSVVTSQLPHLPPRGPAPRGPVSYGQPPTRTALAATMATSSAAALVRRTPH
jgi:DNA-binding NarL/FixJ family response regulator